MSTTSQAKINIQVDAENRASNVLKQVQGEMGNLEKGASTLSTAFTGLMGVVSTYAGSQGLGMLMNAYMDSAKQTAQARFFAAGFKGDLDKTMGSLTKFGDEMQRTTGVSGEYATLIGAKLLNRMGDLNKARKYSSILLRGERMGVLDASSAANLMIRASEGNDKALRGLLESMGLSVPKFASLESMFALLNDRITEGEKSMPKFSAAWDTFKERLGDAMEQAGFPFVDFLGKALGGLNDLMEASPAFAQAISAALAIVTTALLTAGIGASITSIGTALKLTTPAFGIWGLAIGAAIGGVLYYIYQLDTMTTQQKENWSAALTLMVVAATYAATMIGAVFFTPLALLFGVLLTATQMSIEGYEMSWAGFKGYLYDTFNGIRLFAIELWGKMLDYLANAWDAGMGYLKEALGGFKQYWADTWNGVKIIIKEVGDYIEGVVNSIINAINRALSAMSNLGGSVVSGAKSAASSVANFAGFRAEGGPVLAGSTYMVGEKGPEMFTPTSSGYITPNGSGGATFIFNNPVIFDEQQARKMLDTALVSAFGRTHQFGL